MTSRENFIAIARRRGYDRIPVSFNLCPSLAAKYSEYVKDHPLALNWEAQNIAGPSAQWTDSSVFLEKYYRD